jgi:hypothetical protein
MLQVKPLAPFMYLAHLKPHHTSTTTADCPTIRLKSGSVKDVSAKLDTQKQPPSERSETTSMPTPSLRDFIAFAIGAIPEVEAVFVTMDKTARGDRIIYVWTVVRESLPEVRRKIYAKEIEIIDKSSDFDFDFNIIASHGRDPQSVVADSAVALAYRKIA